LRKLRSQAIHLDFKTNEAIEKGMLFKMNPYRPSGNDGSLDGSYNMLKKAVESKNINIRK
jgi:hypothetical protein